ncbi:MAG: hypothetical protein FJ125_01955 [Deltaproteobacteria bacterium]|nr:hypothetical protein [Deltaproteobacteria bacterium]
MAGGSQEEDLARLAAGFARAAAAAAQRTARPPADDGPPIRFRRNHQELLWLGCVLLLGLVFAITLVGVLVAGMSARWRSGRVDPLVDGLWITSCLAIVIVVALIGREVLHFWRKRVVIDGAGLRVGPVLLGWEQLALLREGREFRAGEWFYHLEIRGRGGERAWVTSGLIADYPAFRVELLRRTPQVPMQLLPD